MAASIVCIVGRSNTGKTTLVTRLVPELKRRGYRVGTVKHDRRGSEIDHEGKDSYLHFHSGADATVLASPKRVALVKRLDEGWGPEEVAEQLLGDMDLVLVEGFKGSRFPKIEVFRSDAHDTLVCTDADHRVAVVTDVDLGVSVPQFAPDDVAGVVDLIERMLMTKDEGRRTKDHRL